MNQAARQDPIQHEESATSGVFYFAHAGARAAALTYRRHATIAPIDFVWVDDALRGSGSGRRLIDAAVAWARTEHLKIVPACSFARAVLTRVPEYADVL
ncbi:MAG: N-acetyltransferase [Burkholderiaceae bacterium]|nr:N-acetyltransferase [Burkholderiaceae bacterium]